MNADVVVIGGGIVGMWTALELATAGRKVVLFERSSSARAASWAGGGILSALPPWEAPSELEALLTCSLDAYSEHCRHLLEATGIDAEYVRSGALVLGTDAQSAARDWAQRSGEQLEVLSAAAAYDRVPGLVAEAGALWLPGVAQVRNPRLLKGMVKRLQQLGVELHFEVPVFPLTASGARIQSVKWEKGKIDCDQVVVAAGAWSRPLLQPLGVELPVKPIRGQMLYWQKPNLQLRHIVLNGEYYVVPRADGSMLMGSTLEAAGFDTAVTAQGRAELLQALSAFLPALAHEAPQQHWAGLRPGNPDGLPLIGAVAHWENLFVNTGHFRLGLTLAPASARLLADLMLHRKPVVNAAGFAPLRPCSSEPHQG